MLIRRMRLDERQKELIIGCSIAECMAGDVNLFLTQEEGEEGDRKAGESRSEMVAEIDIMIAGEEGGVEFSFFFFW